ncbi:NAD-dependent epimerase/dehydratase family protein [Mariniluteicoccus flavus]
MRIVVLGATGHIGTFLVPRLVEGGHDVVAVSRGQRAPYRDAPAWDRVQRVHLDREADPDGFVAAVAERRPDTVIDLTCFTLPQAQDLTAALPPGTRYVQTGSLWAWGPLPHVPADESTPKGDAGAPDDYGPQKAAIEDWLLREQDRVRATVIHPGHISGPDWATINPQGNLDPAVWEALRRDGSIVLPERGLGLLQHVHADDVAALHMRAVERPEAIGEAFVSVAERSLTLVGYAGLVAHRHGHELRPEFLPWNDFVERVGHDHAAVTEDHIAHSPHFSTAKGRRLLGFEPAYTIEETVLARL